MLYTKVWIIKFFYSYYYFLLVLLLTGQSTKMRQPFHLTCTVAECLQSVGNTNYLVRYKECTQSIYISRVPQCQSPRPNWDPPTPSPASECVPQGGGGTHSPAVEGVGCASTSPFTISTITYKVVVYAPAGRADTLPLFLHYPICTLWQDIKTPHFILFSSYIQSYSVVKQIEKNFFFKN